MTEFGTLNQGPTGQSVMHNIAKPEFVMAGLVPAIRVFSRVLLQKAWMPRTSPGTTNF